MPEYALQAQVQASDPQNSAWVSANAGSGKTYVLSRRVVRLLLDGVNPKKILCLTYTRQAAANMSSRVFQELSKWISLSDNDLKEEIRGIEGKKPDAQHIQKARQLFARALETPGGLKIQTIHAFCESILHRFPLEANIPSHFELLNTSMESHLINLARRDVLSSIGKQKDSALEKSFSFILSQVSESTFDKLLKDILSKREDLKTLISAIFSRAEDLENPFGAFLEEFGFSHDTTASKIAECAWPLLEFSEEYCDSLCKHAEAVGATFVINDIVPSLKEVFSASDPLDKIKAMMNAIFKKDGGVYAESKFKAELRKRMPDLMERYQLVANTLQPIRDRLSVFEMLESTLAVFTIADFLIGRYEDLKAKNGFLDFNDLISKTVSLLSREDVGAWIGYRLDEGIDHILLDEAQDTSLAQWDIVQGLGREFFIGEHFFRTFFAVGDEKQSIYSFQGASPDSFFKIGNEFSQLARETQRSFKHIDMTLSFRSTDDILKAVDCVFSEPQKAASLTCSPHGIRHDGIRTAVSGYVELWESIGKENEEEPTKWYEPVDHLKDPTVDLAQNIASTIHKWLESAEILGERNRPLIPGDILILVRRRDSFIHQLSRFLKEKNIPVSGIDRLKLSSHIAVQDLIALGRFLLQFNDDLSLASVLKSPLFGVDEDKLLEFSAWREESVLLIDSIRTSAQTCKDSANILNQLEKWAAEAVREPAFEFYSNVLYRDNGRKKMIARLGTDVEEILDEFLSYCLMHERIEDSSLHSLIASLETDELEIKREIESSENKIRIMTVHAAKGLEAPVVFLVDGGSKPFHAQHLTELIRFQTQGEFRNISSYLWKSGSEIENTILKKAKDSFAEEAHKEYKRLLYVGMTRAQDRLIVCGYHGKKKPDSENWSSIVYNALESSEHVKKIKHPVTGKDVLRFQMTPEGERCTEYKEPEKKDSIKKNRVFPKLNPLMEYQNLSTVIQPSAVQSRPLSYEVHKNSEQSKFKEVKLSRDSRQGSLIHKMLEILPAIDVSQRYFKAMSLIDDADLELNPLEKEEIWASVSHILNDESFSFLFSGDSFAEVNVAGHVFLGGKERLVSGRIDRIIQQEDKIWIIDYKTQQSAPYCLEKIHKIFIKQMALYGRLMKNIYPQKEIKIALLFTKDPKLIEIPEVFFEQLFESV